MNRFPALLEPLEQGIRGIHDAMYASGYGFGRVDLRFTDVVAARADETPFHALPKRINDTHRRGLDVGEENTRLFHLI